MTKKKKLFRKVTALAAVIALGASLAGCGSSDGETTQRYSWPLATASPEDTVTQIFAEKFAGRDFRAERWKDENSGLRKLNAWRRPRSAGNVC